MTAALVIVIAGTGASGGHLSERAGGQTSSRSGTATEIGSPLQASRSEKCPSARRAVPWYRGRHADWLKLRGGNHVSSVRKPRNCADARYLAGVWKVRSFAARTATERWIAKHVLRDFRATPGNHAWLKAVDEAQKPYPGTREWLRSCSAPRSEGGWGRFVYNTQGSGAAGWLQFMPSTFVRMNTAARFELASRGYIVPRSAASIFSPLGQALAGAWGLRNGRRHEWSGSGC